ncbi:hypothetical protein PAHAL_2G401500 [Panicum hallii]|uniref:Uncharacterized protein n=1 Tax=Panicum hallii TaxID=206008 RepID=A0A2S3H341_9POAL|nr:uncharacterized protein LOC112880511 [Panicum hallii]PAN14333.1 hypothetical protein PAHAL_2G401500 [Panicum hallii]
MKLFAFVRRVRRSPPPSTSTSTAPAAAPAEKRRRRPSSSGSASWKPTLGAISEDAALTAASAATTKVQAKPAPAAKAKARSPRRATRAASYDDFRHYGPPTVLPAFSPTAFLF